METMNLLMQTVLSGNLQLNTSFPEWVAGLLKNIEVKLNGILTYLQRAWSSEPDQYFVCDQSVIYSLVPPPVQFIKELKQCPIVDKNQVLIPDAGTDHKSLPRCK